MSLRINDIAPDFTATTTQGVIRFHDWIGNSYAVLFSHPKDFTPVCTTELGYMARIEPEFAKRNAKLIGLSVDPVDDHGRWAIDIEETQGAKVKYPLIGDTDLAVAKLYNMLPAEEPGTSAGRTAANNATVRSVFIIGPDKRIKLTLTYPMATGRNFRALEPDLANWRYTSHSYGFASASALALGLRQTRIARMASPVPLPAHGFNNRTLVKDLWPRSGNTPNIH